MSRLDTEIVQRESAIENNRKQLALVDSSLSILLANRFRLKRKIKTAQKESEMVDSESAFLLKSWISRKANVDSSIETMKAFRIKTDKELESSVKKLAALRLKKANIAGMVAGC